MDDADFVRLSVGSQERFRQLGFHKLTEDELRQVCSWVASVLADLGPVVSQIDEVRADGHLVTLLDGSLWEVESFDAGTADMWLPMDDVIVLDGTMYHINQGDTAEVQEVL